MRSLTFLDKNGNQQTTEKWEETDRGVIVPFGAASEVMIPWHRVLEIWGHRGTLPRS